jgi:hypothetical protein
MANLPPVRLKCSCECEGSRFEIDGAPIGRFYCHCLICQDFNNRPYADVTMFRAQSVRLADDCVIDFKRYRAFPGLDRGNCAKCGAPVIEFVRPGPLPRLAFVPSQTVPDLGALPAPSRHIFYERRAADVADDVPKSTGYWPSELFLTRMILADAMGSGRT